MFGQSHSSSPFATNSNVAINPFASSSAAPAFGSPTTTTVGLFGGNDGATTSSNFNMKSVKSSFSGFGSPTTTNNSTAFGGFASPKPTPAFGANAPSSHTLSFSNPGQKNVGIFGTPANNSSNNSGLFTSGNTAPGTFGFSNTSTGFGGMCSSQPATLGFSQVTNPPPFGASASSVGIFGSNTIKPRGFGSTATPTFGSPTLGSTALFANTNAISTPVKSNFFSSSQSNTSKLSGTCTHPYQVTTTLDGNTQIHVQAITGMAAYENRSLEELRYEDYLAGNRGSKPQKQQSTPCVFGNPSISPPLTNSFGISNSSTPFTSVPLTSGLGLFGSPSTGFSNTSFGTPSFPPVFGVSSTVPTTVNSSFGSGINCKNNGFFGSIPVTSSNPTNGQSSPVFSAATKPLTAEGNLFGCTNTSATAGAFTGKNSFPQSVNGSCSFGLTSVSAPVSQLANTSSHSNYNQLVRPGSNTVQPLNGSFGSLSTPVMSDNFFGSSTSNFGIPATPSPGIFFGPPAASYSNTGLSTIVSSSNSAFCSNIQPASVTKPGFHFGLNNQSKSSSSGLFNTSGTVSSNPGCLTNPCIGLFPTSVENFSPPCGNPVISQPDCSPLLVTPLSIDTILAQQLAAVEKQKQNLTLFGKSLISPCSYSPNTTSFVFKNDIVSKKYSKAYTSALSACYFSSLNRSSVKIRPRGFSKILTLDTHNTPDVSVTDVIDDTGVITSHSSEISMSTKGLLIKPGVLSHKPKMRLVFKCGIDIQESNNRNVVKHHIQKKANKQSISDRDKVKSTPLSKYSKQKTCSSTVNLLSRAINSPTSDLETTPSTPNNITKQKRGSFEPIVSPYKDQSSHTFYKQVVGQSLTAEGLTFKSKKALMGHGESHSIVPKLTKDGYTVVPAIKELNAMPESKLAAVPNFSVSRNGYGSITWDDAVDVRFVDLDLSISIEDKDVAVYDIEERNGTKPCIGSKLNRPAVVTLLNVFPQDGGRNATLETKEKFKRKVYKSSKKMGTEHLMYDVNNGVWKFRVRHFSRFSFICSHDTHYP